MFNKNKQRKDGYKAECRECQKIARKLYTISNKDKEKEYAKNNADRIKLRASIWYYSNLEYAKKIHREYNKKWRSLHPDRNCKKSNQYRARKLKAIPSWVDKEEEFLIQEAYHLAKLRSNLFGFSWHVDHILPLKSKVVCGLHTIQNLQVIPEKINLVKSNKILSER